MRCQSLGVCHREEPHESPQISRTGRSKRGIAGAATSSSRGRKPASTARAVAANGRLGGAVVAGDSGLAVLGGRRGGTIGAGVDPCWVRAVDGGTCGAVRRLRRVL